MTSQQYSNPLNTVDSLLEWINSEDGITQLRVIAVCQRGQATAKRGRNYFSYFGQK